MRIIRSALVAIVAILALLGGNATAISANGGFSKVELDPGDLAAATVQPADPELPPDP
ncbi:MAG TPA: hypothetical protein VGA38_03410 [Candidatus Limnocylindria bacterium]